MALSDWVGLGGSVLAICTWVLWCTHKTRPRTQSMACISTLLILCCPPFWVLWYVRGFWGDLSILTACVCLMALLTHTGLAPTPRKTRRRLAQMVLALSVVLYPMALGLSPWNPYHWGFEPFFTYAILLLALGSIRHPHISISLSLALLSAQVQLLESANLWDYILDPPLMIWAIVTLWRTRRHTA